MNAYTEKLPAYINTDHDGIIDTWQRDVANDAITHINIFNARNINQFINYYLPSLIEDFELASQHQPIVYSTIANMTVTVYKDIHQNYHKYFDYHRDFLGNVNNFIRNFQNALTAAHAEIA